MTNLLWLTALIAHVTKCLHPKCIGFLTTQFYKCCFCHVFPKKSSAIIILKIGMCWRRSINFSLFYGFIICIQDPIVISTQKNHRWGILLYNAFQACLWWKYCALSGDLLPVSCFYCQQKEYGFNQSWLIAKAT